MKSFEKITGILVVISLILEFASITGGSFLMAISLFILALFYYVFGFALFNGISFRKIFIKESYRAISVWRIIGAIVTGIALSTICIGILYKMLKWQGAENMLIAGLVPCLIILIVGMIRYVKTKSLFYIRIFQRICIVGGVGIVLLFSF